VDFNNLLQILKASPSGELLDAVMFKITDYGEDEYNKIVTEIKLSENFSYYEAYLVEIIERWDSISIDTRIIDLQSIAKQFEKSHWSQYITTSINNLIKENFVNKNFSKTY
jgi:hypothetical protein